MRYSQFFISTLKEAPSDAHTPSHIFLLRAGFIRQVAAGIFSFLPLGMRVIQKIKKIVREELTQSGAREVLLPMIHPAPLWQESNRWSFYGSELLRFKDRKQFDFALAPTAEEAMVALVRDEIKTYRKLPVHLYQIQDKFRDEARPRAGLLRGREFIMKDGYSFHATEEDAKREYQAMYDAYTRIFKRCGLEFRAVEADTGAIGGTLSHEFQVLAKTGEDHIVSCTHCNYTANVEKALLAENKILSSTQEKIPAVSKIHTPETRTIQEVSNFLQKKPNQLLKTLVYVADKNLIAVVIRGDRDLNEPKLKTHLKVDQLFPASLEQIQQAFSSPIGFLGPVGCKIPLYVDPEVSQGSYIAGANEENFHLEHVAYGRDYQGNLVDLRIAQAGDACGKCQDGIYQEYRGIEVGQVFFLGTKYSAPMHCEFLDAEGTLKPMVMGTYGIGITRIMASAIEQNHDEHGICWPLGIAPFQVLLTPLSLEKEIVEATEKIYQELLALNIDVLFDDRDERPGVKLKDADLIGIPLRLTVGRKSLEQSKVELKFRQKQNIELLDIANATQVVQTILLKSAV